MDANCPTIVNLLKVKTKIIFPQKIMHLFVRMLSIPSFLLIFKRQAYLWNPHGQAGGLRQCLGSLKENFFFFFKIQTQDKMMSLRTLHITNAIQYLLPYFWSYSAPLNTCFAPSNLVYSSERRANAGKACRFASCHQIMKKYIRHYFESPRGHYRGRCCCQIS